MMRDFQSALHNPGLLSLLLKRYCNQVFSVNQNFGKNLKCFSPNLNFLRLSMFLRYGSSKIINFCFTSVLPFCQYCARKLTSVKPAYIY